MTQSTLDTGSRGTNQRITVGDIGPVTQARNRILDDLSESFTPATTTNEVTWSETENIHEITCLVTATAGEGAQAVAQGHVDCVINAPSRNAASVMLSQGESSQYDSQIERFLVGERFVIRSKEPITSAYFLPVDVGGNMTAIKLWVGAH